MFEHLKNKWKRFKKRNFFQEYPAEIQNFDVEGVGTFQYAQWLHPAESKKDINFEQIGFYKKYIKQGDFVIDIGAHTGDTTVPIALACGKEGTVLGLEPNPHVFKILEQNATLNKDKTNIKPLCIAATKEDGEFKFNYSDRSFCNGGFLTQIANQNHKHKYVLKIQGMNLENLLERDYQELLPKLSFVKMDAEGYDKEILKNITPLLKAHKPTVIAECINFLTDDEKKELFHVLADIGYKVYHRGTLPHSPGTNTLIEKDEDITQWKETFKIIAKPNA